MDLQTTVLPNQFTNLDPLPADADIEPQPESDALEFLFSEINSIAIRLRQGGRPGADSPGELPAAEYAVLDILDRLGAATVPQIARARGTSRQNVQILADRLAAAGRVESVPNPAHKRSCLIQSTAEGKRCLETGGQNQRQLLARIAANLSQPEISATVAVLRRIHGLLSSREAGLATGSGTAKPQVRIATQKPAPDRKDVAEEEEEFPLNLL